jgi:cobalt-zinc-cadmium resistance protein CzcA
MITRLLSLSVGAHWWIVLLTAFVAGCGAYELTRLPLDALPDITNKQVMINYAAPALGPEDVEKRITFPIETAIAGLAGIENTRSFSRNGYGQVTAVFREDTNLYFMRQQVAERLAQAKSNLPPGVEPQLGPVSTGLGEIFMYSVEYASPGAGRAGVGNGEPGWQGDGSYLTDDGERLTDEIARLAYLRTVQDWILKPQLKTVSGVADIDSLGGYEKQYIVEQDAAELAHFELSYSDVAKALQAANLAVGANYIQRNGEAYLVRADARIHSMDEIGHAVVATRRSVPITINDVARVRIGGQFRTGAASKNGREVVIGTALMLTGENSRTVASSVREKFLEIRNNLPPSIVATILLDRSQLVNATITTVAENLAVGALLVIATLFLLLGNARAALIATLVIPLSLAMAATGMNALGVPANLMSLGALDFGLIIDGAIIIVENTLRRIAEQQKRQGRAVGRDERLAEALKASEEMVRPTVYGQIVIFLVFVPCLAFQGVEGKMFSPMVITLMLALASAFLLSVTFVPAMAAILFRGKVAEREVASIRVAKRLYSPALAIALAHPWSVVAAALATFGVAVVVFSSLGRVFIPTLDEINIDLASVRIPSISMDQSKDIDFKVERALLTLPEVDLVFSKAGTANLVFDAMPPNNSDNYVILKPKDQWPPGVRTKEDVQKLIGQVTEPIIGNFYEMTQPIQMRFNELLSGARSEVAVAIYGDDLDQMGTTAKRIARVLAKIPGVADLRIAQTRGFPSLDVQFDRARIARYGLTMEDVADTVAAALGGRPAGQLFNGDRRYQIVVRVPDFQRNDLGALGALPVLLPGANTGSHRSYVPLRELARFSFSEGLNEISPDNGKRRIFVEANVRGRDIGSFVDAAQSAVARDVRIPPGSWLEWGGEFKNLQRVVRRLQLVVPVCMVLIAGALYMALDSIPLALAVFTAVPLAMAGGVFALALRGIPFSVSAAVGFIAVSGVAVLNGLVLIASIQRRLKLGDDTGGAIFHGALERVRPVLMTALVASLGFVPMAIATGTGAEVQRPLATVVIGGLLTSTALTLFLLPAVCSLLLRRPKTERISRAAEDPSTSSVCNTHLQAAE